MLAKVTKEFHFSYGHRLIDHPGHCSRYHGHNAKVEVSVDGSINLETGMVIDFYDLNKVVKPLIDFLDHKMILQQGDPLIQHLLEIKPDTLIEVEFPPTAENLGKYILEGIENSFNPNISELLSLSLKFWETPSCYIEVWSIK